MHDLDRTLNEFEAGFALETDELELEGGYQGEYENEWTGEYGVLNETDEMALAAELLEVQSEEELEQFFGSLIKRAAGAARSFAGSAAGKALGGILKDAAGKAIPVVGGALGNWVGGAQGQQLGQQAGGWLKGRLGLELESDGELEFETARSLVRVAATAAQAAAQAPASASSPVAAAKQAAIQAARTQAPQLVRVLAAAKPVPSVNGAAGTAVARPGGGQSGTWVRRNGTIILFGV